MTMALNSLDALDDAALRALITEAVKTYAARVEAGAAAAPPVDAARVTATEVVVAVSDLIRAVDLNLFDVAMWFRRPLPALDGASHHG